MRRVCIPFLIIALTFSACSKKTVVLQPKSGTTTKSGSLPPGQAKKVSGSKSAKEYAPGQQKKASPSPATEASSDKKRNSSDKGNGGGKKKKN